MLKKNVEKMERKNRRVKSGKFWTGLYSRFSPTKKEKEKRNNNKHKKGGDLDEEQY